MLWDRCHKEIMKGETKHLIVLSSVPVAYPRVVCDFILIYWRFCANSTIGNAQELHEQPQVSW